MLERRIVDGDALACPRTADPPGVRRRPDRMFSKLEVPPEGVRLGDALSRPGVRIGNRRSRSLRAHRPLRVLDILEKFAALFAPAGAPKSSGRRERLRPRGDRPPEARFPDPFRREDGQRQKKFQKLARQRSTRPPTLPLSREYDLSDPITPTARCHEPREAGERKSVVGSSLLQDRRQKFRSSGAQKLRSFRYAEGITARTLRFR
jgi:hypothetical protein